MPGVVVLVPLLAALSAGLATHAQAQAQALVDDVKACRQLPDVARRVACYDAMALPAEQGPAPAAAAQPAVDAVAKFGQESVRPPAGTTQPKRIDSRIRGKFAGWRPNSRLALENGQVWRIADDSEALYDLQDPKVTVHRGLLGAFFLEIEGVGFNVRVVRVR